MGNAAPNGRAPFKMSGPPDDHEIAEVIDYFSNCRTKQQVLDGIIHFSGRYFGCVGVYAVRNQQLERIAEHLEAAPSSTPNGRLTIFKRCISSALAYSGPIPVMDLDDPRMATLVTILPERCWVYPVAIGEQIDCLLYAEAPKVAPAHCTERFECIIHKASLSLRRLIIEQLMVK